MNNDLEAFVGKTKRVARTALRHRWLALGVAAGAALACGIGITAVPERYEARARVYVDTQTVLKPLMVSLTFQPDIDEQVRMLARTLVSRPNMERLVRIPELQMDVSSTEARGEIVSRLMEQIKVSPTVSGNLYEISYRGASPERAQRVVEAMVHLFVNTGAGEKKRDSEDAGRFIEDQIRRYEAKLIEAESRLKDFKVRNFSVSGVSSQDYFTRMSAMSDEVGKLRLELNAAEQSRDSYRRELASEEPQLRAELASKFMEGGAAAPPEAEARLNAQRKLLDELLRRYTEEHPDVIGARRIIGQLEVEARERKAADERALAKLGKAGRAATSPVYQKLRVSLAETEAQVASLRSRLAAQQGRLDQIRSLAGRVPQVEAELAQLNRDYEIMRKNYDLMVSRRESAALGVKLDETSQLAEFRVVEPARVSPSPVFPGRLHLASITIVLSLAAGVAAAIFAELIRPTIDRADSLRLLSSRPVAGTVSMLATPQVKHAQRADQWRFAVAFGFLIALQAMWVTWIALKLQHTA